MTVSDLVKSALKELERVMQTRTVVGEPIPAGEFTVIPVSKVTFGFGAGGGTGEKKQEGGSGEGIGGGWTIDPVAFVVVGKEGAKLFSVKHEETFTGRLIDLAPKVADTVKEFLEKKKGHDAGPEGKTEPGEETR
ncbi:MAG: GerW family sporulation protein [Fidelibacterota bacterium]